MAAVDWISKQPLVRQWQRCAVQLALIVAQHLAGELGFDEATKYMQAQVGIAVDPKRFRAAAFD